MIQTMIAASIALATATSASVEESSATIVEQGVVVRQPERPLFGSGILAVWIDFDVESPGGVRRTMYMLYGGEEQFVPPIGSVCRIVFEPTLIEGTARQGFEKRTQLRNVVNELACDTGSGPVPS